MNDQKEPKESVFKKKGFYVALYSSLGVVMIVAAIISFVNLQPATYKPANNGGGIDLSQMQQTLDNSAKPYLSQNTQNTAGPQASQDLTNGYDIGAAGGTDVTGGSGGVQAQAPAQSFQSVPDQAGLQAYSQISPTVGQSAQAEQQAEQALNSSPPQQPVLAASKTSIPPAQKPKAEPKPAPKKFKAFSQDSKMLWPVLGQVVMDFSDKLAIYDKTLDQYRTNEELCIQAAEGTQVKAAADGIVKSVKTTDRNGNMIVIDDGNGWVTTYSQLQDGMLVKPGDVVSQGQVIGGVAKPSIYSVLLGSHLAFEVQKDGVPVDPKSILSN